MFSSPHSPSKKSDFPSKISGSKSIGTSSTLTGVKDKLGRCRRCCFRNGLYPMAIAPFVTLAWLVDLYCCTGCDLLNIDVGFEPSNDVWKNPNINLGLFFYQNRETDTDINEWMDRIHNSCQSYDSTFEEYFIEGDQTWLMSRWMAFISIGGGCLATVLIWLIVLTPLPACGIWPGILLPLVLISFLTSGCKLFFFQTGICRSKLWDREDSNEELEAAESCRLSNDSILNIAAAAIYGLSIILICIKTPSRRRKDDIPGLYGDIDSNMEGLRTDEMEDSDSSADDEEAQNRRNALNLSRKYLLAGDDATLKSVTSNTSSAYDLNDIRSDKQKSKSIGKMKLSKVAKIELQSEILREAEASIDYEEQDLVKAIDRCQSKNNAMDTSDHSSVVSYTKDVFDTPDVIDKKSGKGSTSISQKKLSACPAKKPSDVISYFSDKSTITGQVPPKKEKYSQLHSPSALNAIKTVPSVAASNQSNRYDNDLLQQCVLALTKSFETNN